MVLTSRPISRSVICQEYQVLNYSTINRDGYREYRSDPQVCAKCPTRELCTQSANCVKIVQRHIWKDYEALADDVRHTPKTSDCTSCTKKQSSVYLRMPRSCTEFGIDPKFIALMTLKSNSLPGSVPITSSLCVLSLGALLNSSFLLPPTLSLSHIIDKPTKIPEIVGIPPHCRCRSYCHFGFRRWIFYFHCCNLISNF